MPFSTSISYRKYRIYISSKSFLKTLENICQCAGVLAWYTILVNEAWIMCSNTSKSVLKITTNNVICENTIFIHVIKAKPVKRN